MEILSPASNIEHIRVAIDSKSNAVYGGLKKWNARNKAINFSNEEYNFLIDELHKYNIKFYLTLNILMMDDEINEVITFLKNNKLPDAFIVTDIGLISQLNKTFPNVPLHFSTQFGCHNIDDVNFIQTLNGGRAILSRELTLDEVNNIRAKTNVDLECFIWGSQCLSFSGLCFFGTLINGGGGNRGKCIITCRDIYSINNEKGHYLYVPDMDCINLISKLNEIDCLKIEGRRRNPNEIKQIIEQINNKIYSSKNVGYLFGVDIKQNNLYEKINKRTKPYMPANKLLITKNDVCLKYENGVPKEFSSDYDNPDVMYIYTEIKKDYNINKKNINLELEIKYNILKEVLYVNYKGDGHTFFEDSNEYMEFNLADFIKKVEQKNEYINIYKVKYKRNNDNPILIDKKMYVEMFDYILKDCIKKNINVINNNLKISKIYLETRELNVIENFIGDDFIKIIYDISTIGNLKNISPVINMYGNKIIYKLPLFNWKSEDISKYLILLKNKEIMFTRFTQIYLCKNIKFKKKYIDYTIYVWNKKTLSYLIKNGINEFTVSPELSYQKNKEIFGNNEMQVILCGRLPLVYTRDCFGHLYECKNCKKNQCQNKRIKNEDKNLTFDIFCNADYRYILNSVPILNNYSKIELAKNINFRYVTTTEDINSIKETIECLKSDDYYDRLLKIDYWKDSYECNLIEGKE